MAFFVLGMYVVYILRSEKLNRFYTGSTGDLSQRLEFHRNSADHKFTHRASDWELFLTIDCKDKTQALKIEMHIKSMKSVEYIRNLKRYPEMISKLLERYSDC